VNIYEMKNAPRLPQRPRLRNDARTLLRSRAVQGVLAVGTVLQLAVFGQRLTERPEAKAAPVAVATRPVAKAPALERVQELRVREAEPARKAAADAEAEAAQKAEQLAEKYRRMGYDVSDRLARQIHEAATENGIDPGIAFGLVRTESGFRNAATSHVGATGLTQLMPATARWMEPGTTRADLRNSETNLRIGFRYLRRLVRKYDGDTTLALLAYNRGPGTVDRLVRRGRDPDNGYADMVRGLRTTHR
jgi:soluble lytic murein transglycosylase-like protein